MSADPNRPAPRRIEALCRLEIERYIERSGKLPGGLLLDSDSYLALCGEVTISAFSRDLLYPTEYLGLPVTIFPGPGECVKALHPGNTYEQAMTSKMLSLYESKRDRSNP